MITIGTRTAACPCCTSRGRHGRDTCRACNGSGRIAQAVQHGEEPTG